MAICVAKMSATPHQRESRPAPSFQGASLIAFRTHLELFLSLFSFVFLAPFFPCRFTYFPFRDSRHRFLIKRRDCVRPVRSTMSVARTCLFAFNQTILLLTQARPFFSSSWHYFCNFRENKIKTIDAKETSSRFSNAGRKLLIY